MDKLEIYARHITSRKAPVNIKENDVQLFAHEYQKEIQAAICYSLKDVFVLRDTIYNPRNLSFYTSFTHMDKISSVSLLKRLKLLFYDGEILKKGIWIIDDWSSGYFHWFTDALPRLIAAEKLVDQHCLILPSYYANIPFIKDSLAFFKYKICYYNSFKKLKVENLLLTSHTAFTGNYNKLLIKKLRNNFLSASRKSSFRKIYISRSKAPKRKILNETEVVAILKDYNFEIHYFEDYSFSKQVQLMSETKTLIGLHGAGLTNMLFMPEKGQVLELRNRGDGHNNCYFSLASELDIDYYYQQNTGNKPETNTVDIIVDLEELKNNIELMKTNLNEV